MKSKLWFVGFLLLLSGVAWAQERIALKVVIIRHGEKPEKGDNLSCEGLYRAMHLPPVLDTAVGMPNYTYVPQMSTGKKTTSVRMFQTVTPFAVHKNLTIDSKYKESDTVNVAKDVLKKQGVVLMVWEHSNIPGLASQLGVPGPLSWSGKDFDSIWTITFTRSKKGHLKFAGFTIGQENITPPACQ